MPPPGPGGAERGVLRHAGVLRRRRELEEAERTMKVMSASIEIEAPPEDVWAVLVDLDRYAEWNPLFREASGQVAVGKPDHAEELPAWAAAR